MNAEWSTKVVIIFVLSVYFAAKCSSAIHSKRQGKYYDSKLHLSQHGPRRSGILETVQAIPTSTTPTARVSARVNTLASSTKDSVKNPDTVNSTLALKTNFSSLAHDGVKNPDTVNSELALKTNVSSPVLDNAGPNNVTVVQNATNRLQNLASYSLDQPNSFPRPTSIPAIDTISAAWPTPMGSIDNEMDDTGNPPSLQPIANEMSSEEKIPGIQGIPNMAHIPLDFQEEPPWERSHTSAAKVAAGHATHSHARFSLGHVASRRPSIRMKKLLSAKSRRINIAHARQKESFAAHQKTFLMSNLSRIRNTILKVNKFRRKEKLRSKTQNIFKHKESQNGAKRSKEGNNKKWKKRVSIPPPKPIDPIKPLLEKFQKEKEVGDIKEHTVDIETVAPNEGIDQHLISLKSQPKIKPIAEHLSKEKPDDIEPIENHQLNENGN